MNSLLSTVPEGQKVWVIRASRGKYFNLFRKHGVIAISHLDILPLTSSEEPFSCQPDELEKQFTKKFLSTARENEKLATAKRRSSSHWNQIKRFIYDMKIGDLVITLTPHKQGLIAVGRITGLPRYNNKIMSLENIDEPNKSLMCTFGLRRNVEWAPPVHRTSATLQVANSFQSHHTVFDVTKHIIPIYHLLFPAFTHEGTLHASFQIKNQDSIHTRGIANLFTSIADAESLALLMKDTPDLDKTASFSEESISNYLKNYGHSTTKASFFSPGEVFVAFDSLGSMSSSLATMYILYSIMFGDKIFFKEGLLHKAFDEKTRAMAQKILSGYAQMGMQKIADLGGIELGIPSDKNSKILLDKSKDEIA